MQSYDHKSHLPVKGLDPEESLKNLIFEILKKETMLTPDQKLGKELTRINDLLKKVAHIASSRSMPQMTIRDRWCLIAYEDFLISLIDQANGQVFKLGSNIPKIFFRICQVLEIPAKLLFPDNLPESLASVFLYIIQLSDEIRSTDLQSDEFLEKIQRYKHIADVFCKINIDQLLLEKPSDLSIFFQLIDEKLTASGKPSLAKHDVSSLNELFISPDFVFAGFSSPLSEFNDLLKIMIGALMHQFDKDPLESKKYVYALCDIFHEIREHPYFLRKMDIFKFNVLCKLLPWKDFTDFLRRLGNPAFCDGIDFQVEQSFICITLQDMSKSVQENNMKGMDEHYSGVLSNHPPRGFEADRTQILEFVCSQLSIPMKFAA